MTPEVWMIVLTAISLGAAALSVVYARWALSVSRELAEADLLTDVAILQLEGPQTSSDAVCWRWAITNVSRTGIVHVRVRTAEHQKLLRRDGGWNAITRPSSPDYPSYGGTAQNWGADALKPFETGYFLLPKETVPCRGHDVLLRVFWTEIRDKRIDRQITFRLSRDGVDESSAPLYVIKEVERTPAAIGK